jgi:hypothetical protein
MDLGTLLGIGWESANSVSECSTISTLISTMVPKSGGRVKIVRDVPNFSDDVRNQWSKGELAFDATIFANLPTKSNPFVLIPATHPSEHFDALLMVYRGDSQKPLFVALDFKQSEEAFGEEDTDFTKRKRRWTDQQEIAEEYFHGCNANAERSCPDFQFDFVYLFFTTKQTKLNNKPVDILHSTHKVRVPWCCWFLSNR